MIARLADTQAEADRIRGDAEREAEQRRQAALRRASDLVASARREAAAERADAALEVSRRAEGDGAQVLAAGERDATAVRRRAAERMPAYVDRVMSGIRAALAETGENGP